MKTIDYPIVVIGAGAGGLVVAIGAAKAGKKVLLIEKGTYGGDCTNFGCVPSKSLIASAEIAHALSSHQNFGIEANVSDIQTAGVLKRTRSIVERFKKTEGPEVLSSHGVDTLTGTASFIDPYTLEVTFSEGRTSIIRGQKIILATGSAPVIPKIEGLKDVPYLTNETIFSLTEIPKHLAVIGGGPIGTELAHAFKRLGADVTLIQHAPHLLMREEPEAQKIMESTLKAEGVNLLLQHETLKVENGINLTIHDHCAHKDIQQKVSHLLVATGRSPSLKSLNLEAAGIKTHKRGICIDHFGRTKIKHIWAIGDVTGGPLFTHMAEAAGRRVLQNLIAPRIFWKKEQQPLLVPRVTYTDPEVAAIGLTETAAHEKFGKKKIAVYSLPFNEVDRAVCAGREEGVIKVVTKKWSSQILGATIVAPRAGEMLMELAVAIEHKIPLRKLSSVIHPYPIYSRAIRKAADQWLSKTILPTLKSWLKRK